MSIKHSVALKPFNTPNFVIQEMEPGKRQDGMVEAPKYKLSDLEKETLEQMCKQFRDEVMQKAGYLTKPTN